MAPGYHVRAFSDQPIPIRFARDKRIMLEVSERVRAGQTSHAYSRVIAVIYGTNKLGEN